MATPDLRDMREAVEAMEAARPRRCRTCGVLLDDPERQTGYCPECLDKNPRLLYVEVKP